MSKPKLLTTEQARWLKERARDLCATPGDNWDANTCTYYEQAIDELTAKGGQQEFCGDPRCEWWFGKLVPHPHREWCMRDYRCTHPDFTPGTCPIGR